MDPFDVGYLIGLIVGEGSFTSDRGAPLLSLKMHDEDPAPFRRLARSLGGKVYGPYHHDGRHFFLYRLRGQDLRTAVPLLFSNLPTGRKRRLFLAWAARHGLLETGEASPT